MTRLQKLALFALAFFVALLVGHQNAHAAWTSVGTAEPALIASDFNHRDFQVRIWRDRGYAGAGYAGRSFVGGSDLTIWLGPLAYRDARRGNGFGVWILLHEIGHTLGLADEHAASVWGYQHLVAVLHDYFGQSYAQARAGYRAAVVGTRSAAPEYQP